MTNQSKLTYLEIKIGKPKTLIIMLHGYGSNREDIFEISKLLNIKDCVCVAPNAPEACEINDKPMENGYQWFSMPSLDEKTIKQNLIKTEQSLYNFITDIISQHDIPLKNVILLGFSQGGIVATHISLLMQQKLKGVICLSSVFINAIKDRKITNTPKIFFIHGTNDKIIPVKSTRESCDILKNELEVNATMYILPNLSHTIDYRVCDLVSDIISDL